MEVESGTVTEVDHSEVGEISQYSFSPDGKWIAYTRADSNQLSSIYLFELATRQSTPVTTSFSQDYSPVWDPDGKYLFFLSDRSFNPVLGQRDFQHIVTRSTLPCALILQADGRSPFLADELLAAAEEDEDADEEEPEDADDAGNESELDEEEQDDALRIDLEGLATRVVEFPVEPGNYADLAAARARSTTRPSRSWGCSTG